MSTHSSIVAALSVVLVGVVVSGGCIGKKGKLGNLRFCGKKGYFRTADPTSPLAPGAKAIVEICGGARGSSLTSASSRDESVFDVTRYGGDEVRVWTRNPGVAELRVRVEDGTEGAIDLEVDTVDGSEVHVRNSIYYDDHIRSKRDRTISALKNDEVLLRLERYSGKGERLHGARDPNWRLDGARSARLTGEGGDFANVIETGRPESFTVRTRDGGRLSVDVIDEAAIDRIALRFEDKGSLYDRGDSVHFEPGDRTSVEVVAFGPTGRLVVGEGDGRLRTQAVHDRRDIFAASDGRDTGPGAHLFEMDPGRATSFEVTTSRVVSRDVRFSWMSHSTTLSVTVDPE